MTKSFDFALGGSSSVGDVNVRDNHVQLENVLRKEVSEKQELGFTVSLHIACIYSDNQLRCELILDIFHPCGILELPQHIAQ